MEPKNLIKKLMQDLDKLDKSQILKQLQVIYDETEKRDQELKRTLISLHKRIHANLESLTDELKTW